MAGTAVSFTSSKQGNDYVFDVDKFGWSQMQIGTRYVAEASIGRGGFGEVWRGRGPSGPVAIKLLNHEFTEDKDLLSRFVQEYRILSQITHPGIVHVHDLVMDAGRVALIMDLVSEGDLGNYLRTRRGPMPMHLAVHVVADVAEALNAVHAAGIVHRDLKPGNILLARTDPFGAAPVLADFGIARLLASPRLTRASMVIGTPQFMAPELASGASEPSPAADVYAAGILLYRLVAGHVPYDHSQPLQIIRMHVEQILARPDHVSNELWATISASLAKDPRQRPNAATLASWLRGLPGAGHRMPLPLSPLPASAEGFSVRSSAQMRNDNAFKLSTELRAPGQPSEFWQARGLPEAGEVPEAREPRQVGEILEAREPTEARAAGGVRVQSRAPRRRLQIALGFAIVLALVGGAITAILGWQAASEHGRTTPVLAAPGIDPSAALPTTNPKISTSTSTGPNSKPKTSSSPANAPSGTHSLPPESLPPITAPAPLVLNGVTNQTSLATISAVNYTGMSVSSGTGPFTWGASNLPPGLSINTSTGAVIGTPTVDGLYNVTVNVDDSSAPKRTGSQIFTWRVEPRTCWSQLTDSRNLQIPDLSTVYLDEFNGCSGSASSSATVTVSIVHPHIGDLIVDLIAPDGTVYNLDNRSGGSTQNLIQTYILDLSSESKKGTWRLRISDVSSGSTGYLDKVTFTI